MGGEGVLRVLCLCRLNIFGRGMLRPLFGAKPLQSDKKSFLLSILWIDASRMSRNSASGVSAAVCKDLPRGSQQSAKVRNLSGLCRAHCILAKLQALIVMLGFAAFLCFHLCSQPHCEWRKRGPIWRPCASNSCHIYGATL